MIVQVREEKHLVITIPDEIVKELGLKENDILNITVENDEIILRLVKPTEKQEFIMR